MIALNLVRFGMKPGGRNEPVEPQGEGAETMTDVVQDALAPSLDVELIGANVRLDTVAVTDLANLLQAMVGAFQALDADPSDIRLVDVRDASAMYVMNASPSATPTIQAALRTMKNPQTWADLPSKGSAALQRLQQAIPEHATLRLRHDGEGRTVTVDLRRTDEVTPPQAFLVGDTTLYGVVRAVIAGDRKITGRVRPFGSGNLITVNLSEPMAVTVGKHMLERVRLDGRASWDPETLELESFEALHCEAFDPIETPQVIAGLRQLWGETWDDVDAEQYVESIRKGEQ